jgi:hypothetical protein
MSDNQIDWNHIVLEKFAGKDATRKFRKHHSRAILIQDGEKFRIGRLTNDPSRTQAGQSGTWKSLFSQLRVRAHRDD